MFTIYRWHNFKCISKFIMKIRNILHGCEKFCRFSSEVPRNYGKRHRISHSSDRHPDLQFLLNVRTNFYNKIWWQNSINLPIMETIFIATSNHLWHFITLQTLYVWLDVYPWVTDSYVHVYCLIGRLPLGDRFLCPCLLWAIFHWKAPFMEEKDELNDSCV